MNGMMRNWLLVAFCFVLAGLAAWQQLKIRELQQQCLALRQELLEARTPARPDVRKQNALKQLTAEVKAAALQQDADGGPAEGYAEPVQTAEPSPVPEANVMQQLAGMMDTPEMKEAIRLQQQNAMNMMYGGLFDYLGLDEEGRASLEELLLDRQMAMMAFGLQGMNGRLTPEERSEQMAQMQSVKKSYEQKIREALGAEDYAVFEEYEQTQPERMQLMQFKQTLPADYALSTAQEHELILAMNDARTQYVFSVDMAGLESNPSQLTEETVEGISRDFEQLNRIYEERAAALLNEGQQKAFAAFLQQQLVMQRAGMKMAVKMFGKDE